MQDQMNKENLIIAEFLINGMQEASSGLPMGMVLRTAGRTAPGRHVSDNLFVVQTEACSKLVSPLGIIKHFVLWRIYYNGFVMKTDRTGK